MAARVSRLEFCRSERTVSRRQLAEVLVLIFLVVIARPAFTSEHPSAQTGHNPQITVRVYNYAKVPTKTLVSGSEEARRIFQKAEVETYWIVCPITSMPQKPNGACDNGKHADLVVINLRILPESIATRLDPHPEDVGFALSTPTRGAGLEAGVFYRRVAELAEFRIVDCRLILAVVMAHEIGHLLLGRESHSPSGIMRGVWGREEMAAAGQGYLLFTPEQSEQLRRAVRIRLR